MLRYAINNILTRKGGNSGVTTNLLGSIGHTVQFLTLMGKDCQATAITRTITASMNPTQGLVLYRYRAVQTQNKNVISSSTLYGLSENTQVPKR